MSLLKPRVVKQGIWAATATQLLKTVVKRALNISGNDAWLVLSKIGIASVVGIRRASEPL